ncbi:MAG: leucine-rich repeat domain-containing protein [Promethearchaeota archaeon]
MTNYGEEYMNLVSRLIREPTPEDGFTEEEVRECESRIGLSLPRTLREYYLTVGKLRSPNTWGIAYPHDVSFEEDYDCEYNDNMVEITDSQKKNYWYGFSEENASEENPKIYIDGINYDFGWIDSGFKCHDFIKFTICISLNNSPHVARSSVDAVIEQKIKKKYPLIFEHSFTRIYFQDGEYIRVDYSEKKAQDKKAFVTLSGRTIANLKEICHQFDLELIERKTRIFNEEEFSIERHYSFRLITRKIESFEKEWVKYRGELIPVVNNTLNLSYYNIKDLSEIKGLLEMKSIHSLDLRGNQLTRLPESLGDLTSLETLELDSNKLLKLPESINKLISLKKLDLESNQLKTFPESFNNLKKLRYLNLGRNQLTRIPESISELESLTSLYLYHNRIEILPELIGKLKSVRTLNLRNNLLINLPESFSKLRKLRYLDLSHNKLMNLPKSLLKIRWLSSLSISNNKLDSNSNLILKKLKKRGVDIYNRREILHLSF